MKPEKVSVAIIGGGIAGIAAAKKLAELHISPLLVVSQKEVLGGETLTRGVLAFRFFMEQNRVIKHDELAPRRYQELRRRLFSFQRFLQNKWEEELTHAGVQIVYGQAQFESPFVFFVQEKAYHAEKVILATGSRKVKKEIGEAFDDWTMWQELPASIVIIGDNKEACEVAYFFGSFGIEVIMVVSGGVLLGGEGESFRKRVEDLLDKVGVKRVLGHTLSQVKKSNEGWEVSLIDNWGKNTTLLGKALCVFSPQEANLPFDLEIDPLTNGVLVNERYETNIRGVFAIGDLIHGRCEPHVAKREGILVAENVFLDMVPPLVTSVQLHKDRIDYTIVPQVCFFDYPLARVGLTIEEARIKFQPYEIQIVEREWATWDKDDKEKNFWVSFVLHKVSQRVLGVMAYGPSAESCVNMFGFAMAKGVKFHEIGEVLYSYGSMEDFCGSLALEI